MKKLDCFLENNRKAQTLLPESGKNTLRIGFSNPSVADSITDVLEQYTKRCLGVSVYPFHGSEQELIKRLSANKLNVIFLPEGADIPVDMHYNVREVLLNYHPVMMKYGGLPIEPITEGHIIQKVSWSEETQTAFVRCFIECLKDERIIFQIYNFLLYHNVSTISVLAVPVYQMIQRSFSELLPSEKGEVLTERYEKVVCQGKRNDILQEIARLEGKEISCGHDVHKKTRDNIGEEYGMVGRNAARYLRVHFLNDDLKLMLYTGKLTLVAGVEISFLNAEEQALEYRVLQTDGIKDDLDNARGLRNRTGNLTMDSIMDILTRGKSKRTSYSSKRVVYIKEKYFKETEPEQMCETIEKALDKYFQKGAASV